MEKNNEYLDLKSLKEILDVKSDINHTHPIATVDSSGLLSANDKKKLDYDNKGFSSVLIDDDGYLLAQQDEGLKFRAGSNIQLIPDYDINEITFNVLIDGESSDNTGSGSLAHAEGDRTSASGDASHAEGQLTISEGRCSHAEGLKSISSGTASHARGNNTRSNGDFSSSIGKDTIADGFSQVTIGEYNKASGEATMRFPGDEVFIIGNGSSDSNRSNAFSITWEGNTFTQSSYNTPGADYAEYFEWSDGNIDGEERLGYFVTFDTGSDKIRFANSDDDYILGVTSVNPAIVGDNFEYEWKYKYLSDQWGRIQYEDNEESIEVNGEISTITRKTPVLNPVYDNNNIYIPRSKRKEWQPVGMIGKLLVFDDGTCQVGDFCCVSNGGIASISNSPKNSYYVMERISENIIKILFK